MWVFTKKAVMQLYVVRHWRMDIMNNCVFNTFTSHVIAARFLLYVLQWFEYKLIT